MSPEQAARPNALMAAPLAVHLAVPAAARTNLNHPATAAPNLSTAAQWPALQRAIR